MAAGLAAPPTVLAEMQAEGLIHHIGLSNVTPAQIAEAQVLVPIVAVQNHYNLAHRADDTLIHALARQDVAYVPFFPLGGFRALRSPRLGAAAADLGATTRQVALAWLLQRAAHVRVIAGTGTLAHLRENLRAAELRLPARTLAALDGIAAEAGPPPS